MNHYYNNTCFHRNIYIFFYHVFIANWIKLSEHLQWTMHLRFMQVFFGLFCFFLFFCLLTISQVSVLQRNSSVSLKTHTDMTDMTLIERCFCQRQTCQWNVFLMTEGAVWRAVFWFFFCCFVCFLQNSSMTDTNGDMLVKIWDVGHETWAFLLFLHLLWVRWGCDTLNIDKTGFFWTLMCP